jgi:hypothetical protein
MTISVNSPNVFSLHSFVASSGFQNQLRLTMIGQRASKIIISAIYPLYTHWQQVIQVNFLNIDNIAFSTMGTFEFAMDDLCLSILVILSKANLVRP